MLIRKGKSEVYNQVLGTNSKSFWQCGDFYEIKTGWLLGRKAMTNLIVY